MLFLPVCCDSKPLRSVARSDPTLSELSVRYQELAETGLGEESPQFTSALAELYLLGHGGPV